MDNLPKMAQQELKEYVLRLEKLAETKAEISADMAEIMKDAKDSGFDVKVIRQLLKIRKLGRAEYEQQQSLLETYLHAIGQLDGTPLGNHGRAQLEAVA